MAEQRLEIRMISARLETLPTKDDLTILDLQLDEHPKTTAKKTLSATPNENQKPRRDTG